MTLKAIPVNFCPTGMVPTKAVTPHVPTEVHEIVEQVHEAWELGITIAHLHARLEDGTPDWRKDNYARILEGVRDHCPELIVCFSTSGRSVNVFEKRSAVIELRPDMCSLTLGSLNFMNQASVNEPGMIQALAEKMIEYGVKPELECFDLGMINYGRYLMRKGLVLSPCYWNLIFGNIAGMQPTDAQIAAALSALPQDGLHTVAFGGMGQHQDTAARAAVRRGLGVRIGIEDNIWMDHTRTQLATNMDLLRRVHDLMQEQGVGLMTSMQLGELGFYHADHFARVQ
ncbi:MAG: 3-keto-5-aminohexanoate cleavage protein [Flavobacteriales bacterium]